MKHYFGSHDISHCDGRYCKIKESCKRYLAHLDLIETGRNDYYTYVIISEKDINSNGGCDIFWKN